MDIKGIPGSVPPPGELPPSGKKKDKQIPSQKIIGPTSPTAPTGKIAEEGPKVVTSGMAHAAVNQVVKTLENMPLDELEKMSLAVTETIKALSYPEQVEMLIGEIKWHALQGHTEVINALHDLMRKVRDPKALIPDIKKVVDRQPETYYRKVKP